MAAEGSKALEEWLLLRDLSLYYAKIENIMNIHGQYEYFITNIICIL